MDGLSYQKNNTKYCTIIKTKIMELTKEYSDKPLPTLTELLGLDGFDLTYSQRCDCISLYNHAGKEAAIKQAEKFEQTIKAGDKITWNEHPQVKSTVIKIERSRFTNVKMYVCSNGCRFQIDEIKKLKS